MKKKLLSILLALVLALSLLPVLPASAATDYHFMVGAVSVTDANAADILGDGLFSYDAETNTLSVKGSRTFQVNAIVNHNPGLRIYVENDATLTSKGATTLLMAEDTVITGPGKLFLNADGETVDAVYLSKGTLTLDDANVVANGAGNGIDGGESGKLTVRNSWLIANGDKGAIVGLVDFKVEGCELIAPSDGRIVSSGVFASEDAYETYASHVEIEPIRYELWIEGKQVAQINRDDILGDGACAYDPYTNTLTIRGDLSAMENLIVNNVAGLTIYVEQDAVLNTGNAAITTGKDLRITGPGKLALLATNYGVYAMYDATVTLQNANVEVVSFGYGITGGLSGTNALRVINSDVHIAAAGEAISSFKGGIELEDCNLVKPEGGSIGAQDILNADGSIATEVTIQLPEAVSYNIWVAGKEVTNENCGNILGNGTAYYDALRNILFVEGVIDAGDAPAILSHKSGLRIFVAKDAALSSNSDVIHVTEDATIHGVGKLTLRSTENCCIFASRGASLTIMEMEIDAKGAWGIAGRPAGEKLIVKMSTIHAEGTNGAICDFDGGIVLDRCEIAEPEGGLLGADKITDADGKLATGVTIVPERYDLTVAGVDVTAANATDILGDGVFSYKVSENTLTVNGDCSRVEGIVIYNRIPDLTICVAGDSTLSTSDNVIVTTRFCTITGPGKLTLSSSKTSGLTVFGASANPAVLTLDGANLAINAAGRGIRSLNGCDSLYVFDSSVRATSGLAAVADFNEIYLEGSAITEPEGGTVRDGSIVDKDGNVALSATLAPVPTFIVYFDGNGGVAPAPQKVNAGACAIEPAVPGIPGWTFGGWYTEPECVNKYDFATPVTADLTLYAKWTEDGETPPVNPFVDVIEDKFYYDAVLWAFYHDPQITNGMDATHFKPDDTCTRGQVVTFLWRAMGKPAPKTTTNPFVDVKSGSFYYDAVLWAFENGITTGMDSTHFDPNGKCTRGHVVTFLWRTEGEPKPASDTNPFVDVAAGRFYYTAVLWAVERKITNGMDAMHFGPTTTCTRGHVVTFLYRDMG